MIRKQIYIRDRQQALLRRLAKAEGASEAEVIRQAIEGRAKGVHLPPVPSDPSAWDRALSFMQGLRRRGPLRGRRRRWTREDLYEERLGRYGRRPH